MKSIRRIFIIIGIMIFAFSQQSFTPCLPNGTQVCVDGLPSCYAAKVTTYGPRWDYPYGTVSGSTEQLQPRTREWFLDDFVYFEDDPSFPVHLWLYTKATSTSGWTLQGDVYSNQIAIDPLVSNDFVYFIEVAFEEFGGPPPCPK